MSPSVAPAPPWTTVGDRTMYSSSFRPTKAGDAGPAFSNNSAPTASYQFSDEEVPDAPETWTLEDLRDIIPEQQQ